MLQRVLKIGFNRAARIMTSSRMPVSRTGGRNQAEKSSDVHGTVRKLSGGTRMMGKDVVRCLNNRKRDKVLT